MNGASLRALGANVAALGADALVQIRRGDALRWIETLEAGHYDLAFADPPYAHDAAVRVAERWLAVPFAHVLGVEHATKTAMPPGGVTRTYGDTAITFYQSDGADDVATDEPDDESDDVPTDDRGAVA